jgi:hypothetical protein
MKRLGAVVFLLVLLQPLGAQTNTGTITGTVFDPDGGVIPGAEVQLANLATKVSQVSVTSDQGIFSFPSLPPGVYRLSATMPGFKTGVLNAVTVFTATASTADLKLEVGEVSEEVVVEGRAPLLSRSSAALSTTVESRLMKDLPFPERSALGAVMIAAGVTGDPQYQGGIQSENPGIYTQPVTPGGSISMGGGRPGSGSVLVDGSDITLTSYPRSGVTFSGETVQEVTVQANGLPAQYGRTGGGIINQTTRSGSSELHGSLSWSHTDPTLQAWTHGTHEIGRRTIKRQNYFGGAVGGPVYIPRLYDGSDKTFFFFSLEPARMRDVMYNPGRIPIPKSLTGNMNDDWDLINQNIVRSQGAEAALAAARPRGLFYQFPLNSQGFPIGDRYANRSQYVAIPGNDLSALVARNKAAQYILSQFPTPENPGNYVVFIRPDGLWDQTGNNAYLARGVQSVDDRYTIKFDHVISDSDRLTFRYTYVPVTGTRYNHFGPDSPLGNLVQDKIYSRNLTLSQTHLFNNTMVNEFRATYMRGNQFRGPNDAAISKDWGAELGLAAATKGYGFPALWNSGTGGGPGTSLDVNLGVANDFSWIRGRHSIKIGGEVRSFQMNRYDLTDLLGGRYGFSAGHTNDGSSGGSTMASFLLGIVNSYSVKTVEVPFYYRWRYYAGYVQDDFKLRPNLTLNLGLRYGVETPRTEKYNRQGSFDPDFQGTLNGLPVKGAFVFAGTNGKPRSLWKTNYMGLEPRLGLAYSPGAFFTIRASYSIYHAPLTGMGNSIMPDLNVPGSTVGQAVGGTGPGWVNFITNPVGPIAPNMPLAGDPLFTWGSGNLPYFDPSDVVPYVQDWSLSMQFQLNQGLLLETSYNGRRGTHLFSSPLNMNLPGYDLLKSKIAAKQDFTVRVPNPYGLVDAKGAIRTQSLLESLRPYQQFFDNAIDSLFDRRGNSTYHGMYLALKQRYAYGLFAQASYAWSKSIDDVSSGITDFNVTDIFGVARPQNPRDLRPEWSLSTYDVPHKFTLSYSYELPVGRGKWANVQNRILNHVIGGWNTSGLFSMQTGYPIWVRLGGNGYWISEGGGDAQQGLYLRPNIVSGVPVVNPDWEKNPYLTPYLNPAAFSIPGSLGDPDLGNASRTLGSARNPVTKFYDVRVFKKFGLGIGGEDTYVEFQADFINALNHPNFFFNPNSGHEVFNGFDRKSLTDPKTAPFTNNAGFGYLNRANTTPGRLIRLGLKLAF